MYTVEVHRDGDVISKHDFPSPYDADAFMTVLKQEQTFNRAIVTRDGEYVTEFYPG